MRPMLTCAILALALTGCGESYDCKNKLVQDKVLATLKNNFFNVLGKSNQPAMQGISALAMVAGFAAEVSDLVDKGEGAGKPSDHPMAGQLDAFKRSAALAFDSITAEGDGKQDIHACRADVHIEATAPKELRNPLLGADETGRMAANVDVRYTIQPDLSGKNPFVLRVTW